MKQENIYLTKLHSDLLKSGLHQDLIYDYPSVNLVDFHFPPIDRKLVNLVDLNYKLSCCGDLAYKIYYCKKCNYELMKVLSSFNCEIRYCSRINCLVQRFASTLQTFQSIKRFQGMRTLWHFSIGFQSISIEEFKNNFSIYKKRYEYVLNKFFEKLRFQGINIQAVRVLDFSFVKKGIVYPHYHFAAFPVGGSRIRDYMFKIKALELSMKSRMRIKTPFHLESYGLKGKDYCLSYLSIRASGMYKYDSFSIGKDFVFTPQALSVSIKEGRFMFLNQILSPEEYLNCFYNRAHFVCIGGLPRPDRHGSNITDSIPQVCPLHGPLARSDIRIEVIFADLFREVIPPPPFVTFNYEKLDIEIIKIPVRRCSNEI